MAVTTTQERQTSPAGPTQLDVLRMLCEADLVRVNRLIVEHMQSEVVLIPQLAGHIVAAGGKRIRPLLTLASARLCGYGGMHHIGLAAAVEFIHTATLLHDDVVDESAMRRGRETANAVWGNQASVLVGDFLFSRAFRLMVEAGSLSILDILANASAVIAEGEVAQLVTANDTTTSEAAYLRVIEAKTAALFAAACRIGAVIAGRPAVEEAALDSYGRNLGVAFQLVDDYLDYAGTGEAMGKSTGDDFREGKITLPVVIAFARADADERVFWQRTLETLEQQDGDLARATALLRRQGALAVTLERARGYAEAARAVLAPFPEGHWRDALADLVDFCVDRAY